MAALNPALGKVTEVPAIDLTGTTAALAASLLLVGFDAWTPLDGVPFHKHLDRFAKARGDSSASLAATLAALDASITLSVREDRVVASNRAPQTFAEIEGGEPAFPSWVKHHVLRAVCILTEVHPKLIGWI